MQEEPDNPPPPQRPSHADIAGRASRSARLVLGGLLLNTVLAAVKFAGGIFGHSQALIADGVESLLDMVSSTLVWGGFRVATRPPDSGYPYGYGKAEPLAALVVSLCVFTAAVWIAVDSIDGILHPHGPPHWATLPLLAGIVVLKEYFSRRLLGLGREIGSKALQAEAWHNRSDALTSVAAFTGIVVAVTGGARFAVADEWGALAACGIIGWNGQRILRAALGDVMDMAAPPEVEKRVRDLAGGVSGVCRIEKCRVRRSGLSHLVDIHVEVDGGLSVRRGHEIAHDVKEALMCSPDTISDVTVHIEPEYLKEEGT